jgi:acetyl esterase/lipase
MTTNERARGGRPAAAHPLLQLVLVVAAVAMVGWTANQLVLDGESFDAIPPPTYDDVSYLHPALDPATPFTTVDEDQPGGRQAIDIRLPDGDARAPVLIMVPGGGWGGQNENDPPPGGFRHYLDAGFAVVSVDYRPASPDSQNHFAQLAFDVSTAIKWVRAHAERLNLNAGAVIVLGESAGAQLAAASALGELPAATDPGSPALDRRISNFNPRPDGLLLFAGPYDLGDAALDQRLATAPSIMLGCQVGRPECATATEEATQVLTRPGMPRTLLVHASDDGTVPYTQSILAFDRLCAHGTTTWLQQPATGGHELHGIDLDVVDQFLGQWQRDIRPSAPATPDRSCNPD